MKAEDQSSDYNTGTSGPRLLTHCKYIRARHAAFGSNACVHVRTHGNAQVVVAGRQGAPEERLKPEDQRNVKIQKFDHVTRPDHPTMSWSGPVASQGPLLWFVFMEKLKRMF